MLALFELALFELALFELALFELAERAEHPAQPGQGLPAGVLDLVQRFPGALRLGVDDPGRRARLQGDDADAVGDHVVQLARDPEPFGGDRFGDRVGAQPLGVLAGPAYRIPGQPRDDGRQGVDLPSR